MYEFWVVATRPVQQNGLGLTTVAAAVEVGRITSIFELLPDLPTIYPIWQDLVTRYNVSGKPAHDARLVAAMLAHGINSILTFDARGFERYEGIRAIHPADVIG